MAILVVVGSMILGAALFVFFSNVYLELASKRSRERRRQARLGATTGVNQPTGQHEEDEGFKRHDNIVRLGAHVRVH
ncbi:hypothetical protein JQ596_30395 [Bradyrhizobium manausense]|uniref:hypothetical protein n=1 Tax=Bradyrhizobium manausense TaxID=989370 RepID=UPI001BA7E2EF|nr:hypothetical protein [Bradyrhizobium manausense]MBR0829847.1 hypothetical protein [Bradyrhizobium manausense]